MKGLIEPYHGKYYTAESASKYIDLNSIIRKCDNLSNVGEGFNTISNKIYSTGENCDADALSIDGETVDKYIIEQGESINGISSSITEMTNVIIDRAIEAYNDLQLKLNKEAEKKKANILIIWIRIHKINLKNNNTSVKQ